jgi:23S rRNA pseudouridine2605 synthase
MAAERSPRQPRKPFQNVGKKVRNSRPERSEPGKDESRPRKPYSPKRQDERPGKTFIKKDKSFSSGEESDRPSKPHFKKERSASRGEEGDGSKKSFIRKGRKNYERDGFERPAKRFVKKEKPSNERDERRKPVKRIIEKRGDGESSGTGKKYATRSGVRVKAGKGEPEGIRLNKYIANSGICSRREADELIKAGVIKVNGEVVTALGSKILPGDKIQYGDQTLSNEAKRYLLLNKQKGYVTTTRDPYAKNTVMELIAGACKERIYPVGRLDRNTTGLLLFTNDGELAKKLMHPRSKIIKMYHVVLDQPLSKANLVKIAEGVVLEGEKIEVDGIEYVEDAADRRELGMEIHSGQNRVIRRIFELFGHKVVRLDRVMYAGLTKKNLPRGRWRFLTEREVMNLKSGR